MPNLNLIWQAIFEILSRIESVTTGLIILEYVNYGFQIQFFYRLYVWGNFLDFGYFYGLIINKIAGRKSSRLDYQTQQKKHVLSLFQ